MWASDVSEKKARRAQGSRDWCFVTHRGDKMPSGYKGELGVNGDRGECRTSGGGGLPFATTADKRGEWGGGGALRGGSV